MKIAGNCHCGNIAFELDWKPDPETIPALTRQSAARNRAGLKTLEEVARRKSERPVVRLHLAR